MSPASGPTGLPLVDRLATLSPPTLSDYVAAVSEYVRAHRSLTAGPAKAAQIRLSAGLAAALLAELRQHIPTLAGHAGERDVSGALRIVKADVSETHRLD